MEDLLNQNVQNVATQHKPMHNRRRIIAFLLFFSTFITLAFLYKYDYLSFLTDDTDRSVGIAFTEKEYGVNFNEKYEGLSSDLAEFHPDENWTGDGNFSDATMFNEYSSMSLSSRDGRKVQLTMDKRIKLSEDDEVKLLLYSPKADDAENIQNLTVRFTYEDGRRGFEFPITNIEQGTNIIRIPVNQLVPLSGTTNVTESTTSARKSTTTPSQNNSSMRNSDRVIIELTSRPNTYVELFFDRLWVSKTKDFSDEFRTNNENIISIKEYDNRDFAYVWPVGGNTAFIKKLSNVKNYTFVTKIIPTKEGPFGIITRARINNNLGHYLTFSGIGSGEWQLFKIGKKNTNNQILDQGDIENFVIEKDQPIWIKMELSDSTIRGYLSLDGSSYTKLTEVRDNELKSGGIGYYTNGGAYLIEFFNYTQQ